MANIDDVKQLFEPTFQVHSQTDTGYIISTARTKFFLSTTELETYQQLPTVIREPATSIFFPGSFEQMVEIESDRPIMSRMLLGKEEKLTIKSADETMQLELSGASANFLLSTTILKGPTSYLRSVRFSEDTLPTLTQAFSRLLTVKVTVPLGSALAKQKDKLHSLAEAGLFHIAYGRGTGLRLVNSWEDEYFGLRSSRRVKVQFPLRTYKSDLVSYYQLAISNGSLMLGYICLYKILEYFYVSASETVLHNQLKDNLVSPEFSHTKQSQLRKLATTLRKFDQKMDEQKMLTTVINQYFTAGELIDWVQDFDKSKPYYTTSQTVFGKSFILDVHPERVHSSLAVRVYHLRNALVHNKEGELPRFIPYSDHEGILSKEIPVMLFLAEQLILKTGTDI